MSIVSGAGEPRWYVVHTRPHQEARAETHLDRQGFKTFAPVFARTVRHGGRFRTSNASLFPRYIFVQFDIALDRWRCVNGTLGVSRLIMAAEVPLPVPIGAVEEMILSQGTGVAAPFEAGAAIRVATGPFSGFTGRLTHLDDGGRVKILLSILGGMVPFSIDAKDLLPAA